jgi:amidohydrolase
MMNKKNLIKIAFDEIDKNRDLIIKIGNSILHEPEEGFRENKTAQKVKEAFDELGILYRSDLALTGIKGVIGEESKGPVIAIICELDSIINHDHPLADKVSGAAHGCGHYAQVAQLIAAAIGLKKIMDKLSGQVVLFAVPAEEFINLEFRETLKKDGHIKYFGGKQELIRLGEFDDIDIVIMQHAQSEYPGRKAFVADGSNGFVGKSVRFIGKEAHAGDAPFNGINALNAFNIALSAIHAQRETFRDQDSVRVHPIITKGGDVVNNVPSEVKVELYVRARTVKAIKEINRKIDIALMAGAMAVGAEVEISNTPGYLPVENNTALKNIWVKNAVELLGEKNVLFVGPQGGSTDMGDLTQIKPGIHPYVGSFSGELHSRDFKMDEPEMAFIISSKIYVLTIIDLLFEKAETAKDLIREFKPTMTKDEYLELLDSLSYKKLWRYEG